MTSIIRTASDPLGNGTHPLRSAPGVQDVESIETREVLDISSHDGHPVREPRAADERVAKRCWVRDVERRSTAGYLLIDGEDAFCERSGDALVEPGAQHGSLVGIGSLQKQNPMLELMDRDRGDKQLS
jgi:hypothetical protein